MATIQRRKKSWRAQVRRSGVSQSATFDTRMQAEAWALSIEAELAGGRRSEGLVPRSTVDHCDGPPAREVFTRYANQISPTKRGGRWEEIRIKMIIRNSPLFERPITSITGPDMADWRDRRRRTVSASTVNRELCLISAMFSHAMKEWRMGLTANPCALISKPRKPRPRSQRISQAEREAIIAKLGWDGQSSPTTAGQWVAFAFYLALETAMRKGEILSLQWKDICFEARQAHLDMTKNGDERDVPLSKTAMNLLRLAERREPNAPVVPIKSGNFGKLFRDAKLAAGLPQIRFHDARREAATTMAPKLANVLELAAITGHKSLSMLQVYYKPKASAFSLHQVAERAYACYLLTNTFYFPRSHNIKFLRSLAEDREPRLVDAWPRESKLDRRRFELLKRAYVEARYSPNYEIGMEDLEALAGSATKLRDLVEQLCREQLDRLQSDAGL